MWDAYALAYQDRYSVEPVRNAKANRHTSESVANVFIEDLAGYPEPLVLAALKRCRLEHQGRLTVAGVLSRIDDGRPGLEAAWAQIATLQDECKSLV